MTANKFIFSLAKDVSIENVPTGYGMFGFWTWAYSNIHVPLLRGVLIEYLIIQILIDNALTIVGSRIRSLTADCPKDGDLQESLSPFYSYQPHGDFFDIQLHWGVTIEIKSTLDTVRGSIKKKQWWGPLNGADTKGLKVFPAQYYILAELREVQDQNTIDTNIPGVRFYICKGRDLERETMRAKKPTSSVSFKKVKEISVQCDFWALPNFLREFQDWDVALLKQKLDQDWIITPISPDERQRLKGRNIIPVAEDVGGSIYTRWMDFTDRSGPTFVKDIEPPPWKDGVEVDWRDWEAAGFRYERLAPAPKAKPKPRRKG